MILIPDPPAPGRKWLYRQARTDQNSQFEIDDVAPGKYLLYGWAEFPFPNGEYFDPDQMKPFHSFGAPVEVKETGAERVVVKEIPAGEKGKRN